MSIVSNMWFISSKNEDLWEMIFYGPRVIDGQLKISIPSSIQLNDRVKNPFVSDIRFVGDEEKRVTIIDTLCFSQSFFWAVIHTLCQKILSILCLRFGDSSGILDFEYCDNHFYFVVKNLDTDIQVSENLKGIVRGRWLTQINIG